MKSNDDKSYATDAALTDLMYRDWNKTIAIRK